MGWRTKEDQCFYPIKIWIGESFFSSSPLCLIVEVRVEDSLIFTPIDRLEVSSLYNGASFHLCYVYGRNYEILGILGFEHWGFYGLKILGVN